MRFKIIAVDQASFDAWATANVSPPSQAAAAISGDVAKTPAEFGVCIGCHRVNGTNAVVAPVGLAEDAESNGQPGTAKIAGPNLTDFACRTTIGAGALPNNEQSLREWLNDPGAVKPGNYMATVIKPGVLDKPTANPNDDPNLTNLDVIVQYLMTLHPDAGCVPLTGNNTENIVQLAPAAQPAAAASAAGTESGADKNS
jgi:cytochrome c2